MWGLDYKFHFHQLSHHGWSLNFLFLSYLFFIGLLRGIQETVAWKYFSKDKADIGSGNHTLVYLMQLLQGPWCCLHPSLCQMFPLPLTLWGWEYLPMDLRGYDTINLSKPFFFMLVTSHKRAGKAEKHVGLIFLRVGHFTWSKEEGWFLCAYPQCRFLLQRASHPHILPTSWHDPRINKACIFLINHQYKNTWPLFLLFSAWFTPCIIVHSFYSPDMP